jgi:hypothetical protein
VPADWKQLPPELQKDQGTINYATDGRVDFHIFYSNASLKTFIQNAEIEAKAPPHKLVNSGPLPGGGKWFEQTNAENTQIIGLYKGKGGGIKCMLAYTTKTPPAKDVLDACKTIVVP